MIRLNKIGIPYGVDRSQLMGDTNTGLMADCIYNALVCGEYDGYVHPTVDIFSIPEVNEVRQILLDKGEDFMDHQVRDLSMMLTMDNVFNINKPGYGKTLETIVWIKSILKRDFKALILCPKSVVGTWQNQLAEYWPDYLDCGMWWITNYEQLYDEVRGNLAKEHDWDVIVLDESHTIKSMKSKITYLCYKLKSKHRHCLTGTMIWNRPDDIAAQLKWLDNFSITTYTDFVNCFCQMTRGPFGPMPRGLTKNKQMEKNLRKLLYLYCVGGEVENLGENVKAKVLKVRLKMDAQVKKFYLKAVGEFDEEINKKVIDTEGLLAENIKIQSSIEQATRLQQLSSCPQVFNANWKNVKFDWIYDWIINCDDKVVIMSKFAKTIDHLEAFLNSKKIETLRIKQTDSPNIRTIKLNKFISSGTRVLLGTYGVLATGIDGLQRVCNYAIFVDRMWNASENEQAIARIARKGQTKKPICYILQCTGSIDIRVEWMQKQKGLDARALLENLKEVEEHLE